jgi:hypothetical protein
MADKPHYQTGAADRAHGTHGKGDAREERLDDRVVEPGNSGKAQSAADPRRDPNAHDGNLSDTGWGNAAAGGSVIDKRPPKE